MSTEYLFSPPGETPNDVPNQLDDARVRLYTLDVTTNAEEGSIGVSTLTVDDPNGDFDIVGHRIFAVKETEVAAASNQYVYVGYTTDRKVSRGPYRNASGRHWEIGLVDINTILERRVMVGADCNRPAETDVARVQWLVSTNEGHSIGDTRYLSTASPVAMDAVDYRGQSFKSILDDCAQSSGKNYYLTCFGDTATTLAPWGRYSLWYDFAASTAYSSGIRLSNYLADVDSVTTFAVSQETTVLTRDPSRVYSGVYMPYDGGVAYVQNNTTANLFARRDAVAPAENVKTNAKATARANRYLADIDTEEDVIVTAFLVPRAKVNELREGMRVRSRFTHLPGYELPTWMRVLNRNVIATSEEDYTIRMELSPTGILADNVGEVHDGFTCGENGYIVPTCGGLSGANLTTAGISPSSPGGAFPGEATDSVRLYHGATYAIAVSVVHATTNFECNLNANMGQGWVAIGFGNNPPMPSSPGPPFNDIVVTATYPSPGGPGTSACETLTVYQGAGYAGCNCFGSFGIMTVSYVSGPDPRFQNLPGCPFPA